MPTQQSAPKQPVTAQAMGSAAGHMTVLGLDVLKARFGKDWEKRSERVHQFFQARLEREMRPGDTLHRKDELSYLVIFRDLSAAEAQVKCLAIANEACRHLFGEESGDVAVRSVTGHIDFGLL